MIRRVNHTGLSVSDIDRSISFYRDLLGLELVFESHVHDRPQVEAVVGLTGMDARMAFLDAGDTRIELWQYSAPAGAPLAAGHRACDHGVSHIAFEVDDPAAMYQRIVDAGFATTTEPVDLGIHRTFYCFGPDREIIEILEDMGSDRETLSEITRRRELAAAELPGGEG